MIQSKRDIEAVKRLASEICYFTGVDKNHSGNLSFGTLIREFECFLINNNAKLNTKEFLKEFENDIAERTTKDTFISND